MALKIAESGEKEKAFFGLGSSEAAGGTDAMAGYLYVSVAFQNHPSIPLQVKMH